MGINGPQATACYGGLGTYVCRGENRVNDLECHANCLRERLDKLEAMLPTALIEASIAIQKGERPPDLLQLTKAEEKRQGEVSVRSGDKKAGELPCIRSSKMIEDDDEPRVCMLQVLAKKEKRLRKKIYEMELKEERYKKALVEAGHTLNEAEAAGIINNSVVCQPLCPGAKNQIEMTYQAAATSSQSPNNDPVRQRIKQLEASSKKISLNLKNLHRERAELTCQANNLTLELRCTQKCLGEVQQRVLGSSPSQVIPVMGDPSLDYGCQKSGPCCTGSKKGNGVLRLPQDPKALRTLAGQFKEAYKKAENEGLSPNFREPIRKTADRLRALSNLDPNACPCGQPIKCDSCVICSCAEWEHDLEGGGDEPLESSSSDGEKPDRGILRKSRKEQIERCHCGCNETSSESECPCGCSGLQVETAEICPCSCDQTVASSAISTSDPSTITETTIPSSETDDSGYSQVGRGDACCHVCDLTSSASLCAICKIDIPQKPEVNKESFCEDQCEICRCEVLNDSQNTGKELCTVCPCACTMCNITDNQKGLPPCQICRSIVEDVIVSKDSDVNTVKCTCLLSSEIPLEIQKVCKVENLREGLENLKNRNHAMRKMLKSCGCLSAVEDLNLSPPSRDKMVCNCPGIENKIKQTPSGLMCTVRLLQSKCRTKDGMIVALANELKKAATPEQTSRILECLADPSLCRDVSDFDRSELWNYLKTSSSNKPRVSGRKTCHRDLLIGLIVLFLTMVSHVVQSYSIMPPFSEVITSLKYWMEEIPGNVGYLTNILGNFVRILFQKQCFVSLLKIFGPFSTYLESVKTVFWSIPGMQTVLMLLKLISVHLDSSYRSATLLVQSFRSLQVQFCTQICRMTEYLNLIKRFILFQKMHLPSLKAAIRGSVSLLTSYCPKPDFPALFSRLTSFTDFLPANVASSAICFLKIFISHVLCLWTFIVASPNHLRGVGSFLLYLFSCMISLPAYIQITLERSFHSLLHLLARCGIYDCILPFVARLLSNVSSLIESCCCPGGNQACETRIAKNPGISFKPQNTGSLIDKTCASVSKNVSLFVQSKNLTDFRPTNVGNVSDLFSRPSYDDDLPFSDGNV